MQEQNHFEKFVKDFYDYTTKRVKNGGALDASAGEKIIAIHHDLLLSQQLLAVDLKEEGLSILTDNYCYFMYVYLISKYNRDSLKQEQLREKMILMKQGQSTLPSILLSFSYNHDKRHFTTDDLWLNLAEVIKQEKINFMHMLCLFVEEAFPSPAVLPDYNVSNAIIYLKAALALPSSSFFKQDVPFYLVFEHPNLNDDVFQFIQTIMPNVLQPQMLLSCFKPPKNNDYRLLNYCVEQIVKLDKTYFADTAALSQPEDQKELQRLWDKILFCVPAALYYRDKSAVCIQTAARSGYKPAIARCLLRNYIYRDSVDECFDDIQSLWAEGYLSAGDALKAIAFYGAKGYENFLSTQCLTADAGSIHAEGISFVISSKTSYLIRRIYLLSELCASNHLMFLNMILYRALLAAVHLEDKSSLPVDKILTVINNTQCVLRDTALAKQWLANLKKFTLNKQQSNTAQLIAALIESEESPEEAVLAEQATLLERFKNKPIHLSVLFRAIESLVDSGEKEHHHLQEWLYTDFGALLVQQFTHHCISLTEEHKVKPLAAKIIGVLVSVNLNHLTAWSFELMCRQLALTMPFDQKLNECYQKFKNKLLEIPNGIEVSVKESLAAQGETIVVSELPEGRWFPRLGEDAFASLVRDYENELLQGTMTKERYQLWLSATQRFISQNKCMHSLDLRNSAVIDFINKLLCWHDWSMLATIWKLNGDSRFISLEEFLLNKPFSDEDKENMRSILHAAKYVTTSSAPEWWQDAQSEYFKNLQLKRQQLMRLCKALLDKLAELPTQVGLAPSFLASFMPQAKNLTLKNEFVNMVEKLCSDLSDNSVDVLTALSKFVQETANYHYRLSSNDSQRYLEQLNAFFGVAKNCTEQEIEKSIESKLLCYSALQNVGGGMLVSPNSLPPISESAVPLKSDSQPSAPVDETVGGLEKRTDEQLADAKHLIVVETISKAPLAPSVNPDQTKEDDKPEKKFAMSIK